MRHHILSAQLVCLITLGVAGQAVAGSMDDAMKLIAASEADTAKLEAALDLSGGKLKDPGSAATVKPLVAKCAGVYAQLLAIALKVPPAQRRAPDFVAMIKAAQKIKRAVTIAGKAMPGVFLSVSGKGKAMSIRQNLKTSREYLDGLTLADRDFRLKMRDAQNYFQRALRPFKSMSPADRNSANGFALQAELLQVQGLINAQIRSVNAKQADNAKAGAFCKDLKSKFYGHKQSRWLAALHDLARGERANRTYMLNEPGIAMWAKELKQTLELLSQLKPYCDNPANKPMLAQCVPTHGRPRMTALYAKGDPVNWCSFVPRGKELLQKEIEAKIAMNAEVMASSSASKNKIKSLELNKGWFGTDGLGTWKDKFTLSEDYRKKTVQKFQILFDAIGVKLDNTDRLFAAIIQRKKELAAEVTRLAPKWPKPDGRGNHYGIGLAKKQIKNVFGKVKFYSAGGSAGWTIKKNGLGILLNRDKYGWAIFKVKGDPFCQARTYYISEPYAGGGRYQKDRSVSFGSVRWQKCQ